MFNFQKPSNVQKLTSSVEGSIASLRSIFSTNKVQPANFDATDTVYENKEFDNYNFDPSKPITKDPYQSDFMDEHATKPNCMKRTLKILRKAWNTKYTEEATSDKTTMLKTALRELLLYIVFLIFLLMVAYGTKSDNLYYLTTAISNIITGSNFNSIVAMDSFWSYLTTDLMIGLYGNNTVTPTGRRRDYIYFENRLIGLPRLRQLRVSSNTCKISNFFQKSFKNCFGDFSTKNANNSNYGLQIPSAWVYSSPDPSSYFSYSGTFTSYDDGGFIQPLTRTFAESTDIMNNLQKALWTDHYTRAVFVDFTIYNPNVNLFCVVKLIFEFPATGGTIPYSQIRTVKLIRYESMYDYFILCCEIIIVLFVIYYTIEEIIEIRRYRWAYFKKVWNVLDVFMVSISLISIVINIFRVVKTSTLVTQLLSDPNSYANFDFVVFWTKTFNQAMSIATFFGILKIFKYISFNKTMNQLTDTLGNSLKDIIGFAVMFCIVFFAFAQWGHLQFGPQIADFCRFQDSVFTLFRLILGDFNFMALIQANNLIGPVFFISYVFFVFFVLINIFVAIINDSYEVVKEKLEDFKDDLQIAKFIKKYILNKLRRHRITKIQEVLEEEHIANCEQLKFQDWRDGLQRKGYAEVEIQALFLQYDLDGDRTLDYEERRLMLNDLTSGKVSIGEFKDDSDSKNSEYSLRKEDEKDVLDEELFDDLIQRVDMVEKIVYEIVSKIDNVLVRLGDMEKAKLEHQKHVSCSLSILRGTENNISM